MAKLLDTTRLRVEQSTSVLAFERPPTETWKSGFDRYLTVEGKQAYHIGNICDTCEFFFERMDGANQKVSARAVSDRLRQGLEQIDTELLDRISEVIPSGEYLVSLLRVHPRKVSLGSEDDYFSAEQIALWGIDAFWGLPHYPKVEYYRSLTIPLEPGSSLFEFIIPMYPQNWLQAERAGYYSNYIQEGRNPTALALSVLDIKQPAIWEGDPEINTHWCLAHYLIDGHHKVFAASQVDAPITLLSLLAMEECIATKSETERMVDFLTHVQ